MDIKPGSLPDETRRALLQHLRQQLGDESYRQLSDAMGEERLLEMALQSLGVTPPPPAAEAKRSTPGLVMALGYLLLLGILAALGSLIGGRIGWIFGGGAVGMVVGTFYAVPGWMVGAFLGGAIGGVAGNGLEAAGGAAFMGGFIGAGIQLLVGWITSNAPTLP